MKKSGGNSILNPCDRFISSFKICLQALAICRSTSTPFVENEIKRLGNIKAFILAHKHGEDQETIIDYLKSIEEGNRLTQKTWKSCTFAGNNVKA